MCCCQDDVRQALGSTSLVDDQWMQATKIDLASLGEIQDPQVRQCMFMLAAGLLDVMRRSGYVAWATRKFAMHADPAMATRLHEVATVLPDDLGPERAATVLQQEVEQVCAILRANLEGAIRVVSDVDDWANPEVARGG